MRRLPLLVAIALCGCTGVVSNPGGAEPPPSVDPPPIIPGPDARLVSTGPSVGRRLTYEEIGNSVDVVFGLDLDVASFDLPRDNRIPGGFRNSTQDLLLSPGRVEAYDALSEAIVEQMDFAAFLDTHATCRDAGDDNCRNDFINSAGLAIHRRPLPTTEVDLYRPLFDVAIEEGEGFEAGARLVVRAMIQSPRFLYRLEVQAADGSGDTRAVDPYELATRLSFLIWASAPDPELLALAEAGTLGAQIDLQVRRMLTDPRARRALRQYIEQWLYLDAVPETFPLGDDMKEETYRLFEYLVWEQNADLMTAFSTTRTELSGALAEHYGLTSAGSGFEVYDLEGSGRIGFLTQGSVMTARTINPTSSMIDRGLFVLNDIICDSVPEPDGEALREAIEQEAVPETSGLSQRDRFATQSENPLCATCHGKFDPLGLPFETFGAFGNFMSEDEFGNPLTGEGSLTLGDIDSDYANAVEFSQALSQSETVARCLVEKSVQHAYGRRMSVGDRSLLDEIHGSFTESGRSYQELLVAIATHPEFGVVEVAQ